MDCSYPHLTPLTAQNYGCRCGRCREAKTENQRVWRRNNPAEYKRRGIEYNVRRKVEVFTAYGGAVCRCCGEKEFKFLSLDHIYNDGHVERKLMKERCAGSTMYEMLRRNGFPNKDRYQVLCMNCNFGKKLNNGVCPHQTAVREEN